MGQICTAGTKTTLRRGGIRLPTLESGGGGGALILYTNNAGTVVYTNVAGTHLYTK